MTELPTATDPVVPRRRNVWHVLAWITLATNVVLLALIVIAAIQTQHQQDSSPPDLDNGLAYWSAMVILAVPAVFLVAVGFVALVSILSRQRSVMIAATILGVLVTAPIAVVAGWVLYNQATMPDF